LPRTCLLDDVASFILAAAGFLQLELRCDFPLLRKLDGGNAG
jgi:hypothetical protein